jgi:S-DNA-T family DNA segregation ATPase FtsK/SpoIIIE
MATNKKTPAPAPAAGDKMRVPNLDWEHLPEHLMMWRPGARSIKKPFAFGQRADGTRVEFAIWRPDHGALHPLMGGATGGGKTNTLNVLTAGIVSCNDTVVWYIDVAKKGQAAAPWAPCIDWIARTPAESVALLAAAVRIIEARSEELANAAARDGHEDKVVPSPKQPQLIIMIDEAAGLLGITSGDEVENAMRATELCRQIAQTGRSAAVSLLVATQRPTVASLGNDGDLRAQLFPNICLRMKKRADTKFVLDGVELDTIDATQLNRPGLLYLQDASGTQPIPTRSFALYLPPAVRALSRLYASHRPPLEAAAVRAAGVAYARRPLDPFGIHGPSDAPPITAAPTASTTAAASADDKMSASTDAATTATATDNEAKMTVLQKAKNAVAAAQAAVAAGDNMDELPRIPMSELNANHTGEAIAEQPGDAEKHDAILAVLDQATEDGLTASEIREAVNAAGVELSRAHSYVLLRQLDDAKQAHLVKVGRNNRYHRGPQAPVMADA